MFVIIMFVNYCTYNFNTNRQHINSIRNPIITSQKLKNKLLVSLYSVLIMLNYVNDMLFWPITNNYQNIISFKTYKFLYKKNGIITENNIKMNNMKNIKLFQFKIKKISRFLKHKFRRVT